MPKRHSRHRSSSPLSNVGLSTRLPMRSSRGARIHKLMGEEAEADASFWGQEAWQEDGEDDDYSTEAEEDDVVDSDFDIYEVPDEEVHDAEEDAKPTKRKRSATSSGRYIDSIHSRLVQRKRHLNGHTSPLESIASATRVFEYVAPTVRSSTARKSSESSAMRRRASQEAAKVAAKSKKPVIEKMVNRFTQAQLLAEAVKTEVENLQSLQRLERLEEEKKAESIAPKAPFTGKMVRYYSKIGAPKTITFLNTLEYPPLFNQSKSKKRLSLHRPTISNFKVKQVQADESAMQEDVKENDGQLHGFLLKKEPSSAQAAA
ncbi:hypothetical protein CCR75_000198 [Bremia lactucae]|uniref:Vps72/YL1 N-terminal domain-containing protein n=1 Tax=Bremia lactucae TaxID=4779 RepID=A0A976FNQ9_BRELC|nr:hypothetical protein CCR75_000198 [Bremia lactucae]